MKQRVDPSRPFQLLDIPKSELREIRELFENKRIQFIDGLVGELSKRTDKSVQEIQ